EQLAQIGTAYQTQGTYLKKYRAIEAVMPERPQDMVQRCQQHLAYIQNNYLLCLLPLYKNQRALLFNCLTNLQLQSSSQDNALLAAIEFIKKYRNRRKEWLDCTDADLNLDLITDKWRKLVTGKTNANAKVQQVHKKYFELWVFFELARQLQTGDVFVPQAQQHSDWTKQLISGQQYDEDIATFGVGTGIPTDSAAFIAKLKGELTEAINRTDQAFPANQYARMEDGNLILSKLKKKKSAEHYPEIDRLLKERMDNVGILQLLNYTEQSLQLHHRFHHFSGHKSRIPNYANSLISTFFCYGCFMGPTQAARSIEGASRKQLAWIHDHHVNEERLDNAIIKVINAYQQFQLPKFWGTGRSASADGTHWSTYQKNLFTQYHIRYGAYGGIAYYHVADNYIALFSHFIPCGVYEALYILDGLIKNESKLQPSTVQGDTHAQSNVVFGLAYLLGIKLLPRIRGIKNKVFFRPEKGTSYEHIDELFTETINWKLIETHLRDMLRVVLSIKKGKITPSTILRRLNSQSRKNKLYFAFRELGRAVRTIFLMDYIHDVELRKVIFAATNKSEEFNQFANWVAFANKTIPENLKHEQSKIIKYNHLVANMIMLYNVDSMTRVLNDLVKEGYEITEEIIDAFAPYRTEHINRFGSYSQYLKREVLPLQHQLNVIIRRK
ncbi:MAG: Tn3 family transposase, partial [Saprospiraceae bacterium]